MKKITIILTIITIFLISGCNYSRTVSYEIKHTPFASIKEMTKRADVIVTGTVIDKNKGEKINTIIVDNMPPKEMVFTVLTFNIENVIMGELDKNKNIEIRQLGGTFKGVEYKCEQHKKLNISKRYLLFLFKSELDNNDETEVYYIVNPIQGFLEISNGKIVVDEDNDLFKSGEEVDKVIEGIIN